jgi:hypothetical protein
MKFLVTYFHTFNLHSPLNVKDQVPPPSPYKIDKIIVSYILTSCFWIGDGKTRDCELNVARINQICINEIQFNEGHNFTFPSVNMAIHKIPL